MMKYPRAFGLTEHRGPWRKTVDIKALLDPDKSVEEISRAIYNKLTEEYPEYPTPAGFNCASTVEEIDDELEALYDFADDDRVWLGFVARRRS